MRLGTIILCLLFIANSALTQSVDSLAYSIQTISSKSLTYTEKQYSKLTQTIQTQNEKLLKRMQQKEAMLRRKLENIDSLKSKELFADSKQKYEALHNKVQAPLGASATKLSEYVPGIDSMTTALKFLSQPGVNITGLTGNKLEQVQSLSTEINELEGRLQQANEIQSFIQTREAELKSALLNTGLGKELLELNKEVFYFHTRINEYKSVLNDKEKLKNKVLATVRSLPVFQKFFQKYSYFAQLFPMPDTYGTPQALAGLQTRSNIQSILVQRLGSAGASFNPQSYIQGQVDGAALQLKDLKEKLYKFGGGSGSSDMTMPDFKKINSQRTKSFFQRLEFGFNIQNQRKTMFLPAISDLGLSLGYKISDYKTAGLGLAYKMGWGSGWNNIHFTSEGISIRGFADIKAKGNLWLSGGFEYNYMQRFNNFSQIKNLDDWQSSALIGLTKKQNIGKKEGKMQLLYDFLATKQIPQTQPLKFRIGYNF